MEVAQAEGTMGFYVRDPRKTKSPTYENRKTLNKTKIAVVEGT